MKRVTMCGAVSAIIVSMTIRLIDGCDGPKSSELHCCIFPVARKRRVITTFSSAENASLHKVTGDMTSLTKSLTNMMPALSKRYRLFTLQTSLH